MQDRIYGTGYEASERAIADLLTTLGQDITRDGLRDTPERVAKMYSELLSGYGQDPADIFTFFEPEGYDELVLMTDIPVYSLCEHHMMPFVGRAHVGYLPNSKIVGLSKLVRLVEMFSRRLQVQERLTAQVADSLVDGLLPQAAICVVEAEHYCVTMRGVQKPGTMTTTSALRGEFKKNPSLRSEVYGLIESSRR